MMLFMTERLQRGTWPFTIFGPVTLAGLVGIVLCDGVWVVVSAAAAGLGAAVTFIVSFGLPAILSPPGEVHRMAGGMFTISYTHRGDRAGALRRLLGSHRTALDRVHADRRLRGRHDDFRHDAEFAERSVLNVKEGVTASGLFGFFTAGPR